MKNIKIETSVKSLWTVFLFISFIASFSQAHAVRAIKEEKTVFKYSKIGSISFKKQISPISKKLGNYEVLFSEKGLNIRKINSNQIAFVSPLGKPFLLGGLKTPNISSNKYGSVFIAQRFRSRFCSNQSVSSVTLKESSITIKGNLYGKKCNIPYEFTVDQSKSGYLNLKARAIGLDKEPVWLALSSYKYKDEFFYGGGEQFTELVLNGHQIPFLIQEQGHGRSRLSTSLPLDLLSRGMSGGDRYTTYIPVASILSSKWRGMKLIGSSYSLLDLKRDNYVIFWSHSKEIKMEVFSESNPLSAITRTSESAGLPHKVPEWFYEGAMLGGFIGGEGPLKKILSIIDKYKIHTKTLWIEDWCGVQPVGKNSKRLKWNWEVDKSLYPNWDKIVGDLNAKGIRIGGYLNPQTRVLSKDHYRYNEFNMPLLLKRGGHLIRKNNDEFAITDLGRIDAFFVDLFNQDSYSFLKDIVREKMLKSGIQFWNADFGESLPLENEYTGSSTSQLSIRHEYIEKWAKFNYELIHEDLKGDGVAFIRSGHTGTLKYNQMYWQGDQLTTYDEHDGLYSTTIANISSGLSGILINHSDIGGAVKYLNIKRSNLLMKRWMEKEAFGPLLRSKEGLGTLKLSVVDEPELTKEFAKWADVFHSLYPYRDRLYKEAYAGLPVIRAMFAHFPEDKNTYTLKDQFLFGEGMIVAPIHSRKSSRSVYLPKGEWTHFMTGQKLNVEIGKRYTVKAPVGCPAVFIDSANEQLSKVSREVSKKYAKSCSQ